MFCFANWNSHARIIGYINDILVILCISIVSLLSIQKSRHKLAMLTPVSQMLDGTADTILTIEETLRKLLLCQSMGIRMEVIMSCMLL